MRRLLFILMAVLVLVLAMTGVANANGGPHGGYTAITDACAGCHRTHTATGPALLVADSTYNLCMTCHGTAGTGADTNVEDGFFLSTRSPSQEGEANTADNGPLNAGGFVNYRGAPITSNHDPTGVETDAWGNGVNRGVLAPLAGGETLDCASCHDPHGSPNYRIVREIVNGNPVAVDQVDEGSANKDYDDEHWPANMSNICAACHGSYHVTSPGSGSDPGMVPTGGYTHRTDMAYGYGGNVNPETVGFGGYFLPLGDSGVTDIVVCNTCHLSHGSSAAMTGFADGGPTGGGTLPGNTTADDSALLRLDDRGVCEVCHQK